MRTPAMEWAIYSGAEMTPMVLLLLALVLAQRPADCCMETAWSSGRMDAARRLNSVTLAAATAGGCRCCALCHQHTGCASLSFNSLTAECELYGSVASYATLQPDPEHSWTYFVMPGRSAHDQFCRRDSDCTEPGDACRGRVCTDRISVTCRDIAEWPGSGELGDADVRLPGWLAGRETPLECDVVDGVAGFTELLSVRSGVRLSNATALELNRPLHRAPAAHSILGLAAAIARLRDEPHYQIAVSVDGQWATDQQQGRVPRSHTLSVETVGSTIQVSFQNEQRALTRVHLPTADAGDSEAGFVAQLELPGGERLTAHDWVEIYIRE